MVLNDVFDVEEDREKRPERPLPSGAIAVDDARKLGIGLLAVGVIGGWVAGVTGFVLVRVAWRLHVISRWRVRRASRAARRSGS